MDRLAVCMLASLGGCDWGLDPVPMQVADASTADIAMDAPRDASADAFPLSTCPSGYTIAVTGIESRYRLISGVAALKAQHADCKDDLPGATHLAAFQTAAEATEVGNTVTSPNQIYVGAVQLAATSTTQNWFALTGEALPAGLWKVNEPDDTDGIENGQESFAFIEPMTKKLGDVNHVINFAAVCECDGRAIDPTLEIIITSAP